MVETLIATLERHEFGDVRIFIHEFRGTRRLDVRVFVGPEGKRSPSKKGVSLTVDKIDAVILGMQAARCEALRRSWLPGEPTP